MWYTELATTMHELERDKASLASDPENLKVIFKEMIQMCLWYVCMLTVSLSVSPVNIQGKRDGMLLQAIGPTDCTDNVWRRTSLC